MVKFIKEIFSLENLKKAMVMGLLAKSNLTKCDYLNLSRIINDVENEEVQLKNIA